MGTFAPIHSGHLDTLVQAKKYLENEQGLEVLGAYISPCHDTHARRKLKEKRISVNFSIFSIFRSEQYVAFCLLVETSKPRKKDRN